MPKTIKNKFLSSLTFEKLMAAHKRAKQSKMFKNEVLNFDLNLEVNIINLLNSLKNDTYLVGKYNSFKVYEPKERIIQSLPYKDRVVHQWYVEEFIKPIFDSLIISNVIKDDNINKVFYCARGEKGENPHTEVHITDVNNSVNLFKNMLD